MGVRVILAHPLRSSWLGVAQPDVVQDQPAARVHCQVLHPVRDPGKDWADVKLARRSMVLMAEQVLPKVNQAIAGKA